MEQKKKPYRSKMFMAFCHEHMKPAVCPVCKERPWMHLHHWGEDGGTGMKPNDQALVRLCRPCHEDYGMKVRALVRHDRMDLLRAFYLDALKLNMAYVQHLEGKRVTTGCAREALEVSLRDDLKWMRKPVEERVNWLMRWADRRAVELFTAMEEGEDDGE